MSAIAVKSGANEAQAQVGETVGEVRSNLGDVLNIDTDSDARVDSVLVADDRVLLEGETLEFIKRAGIKG